MKPFSFLPTRRMSAVIAAGLAISICAAGCAGPSHQVVEPMQTGQLQTGQPQSGEAQTGQAQSGQAQSGHAQPGGTVNVASLKPQPSPGVITVSSRSSVSVADNGSVVIAQPGQRITIVLLGVWDPVQISDSNVVRLTEQSGAYPSGSGSLNAVITATAPGTAEVSAESDMACLHANPPCSVAQRAWRIQIVVR